VVAPPPAPEPAATSVSPAVSEEPPPVAWTADPSGEVADQTPPYAAAAPSLVDPAEPQTVEHVDASREYASLFDARPADVPAPPPAAETATPREEGLAEAAAPTPQPAVPGWMPKAFAALAVLALVEAVAIAWLWNRSSEALLREGELAVQSRPIGARVLIDDDEVGVTPVSVRLAPGTYTLKVQAGNAEPRVIVVQIRAGVQTAQYLELQTGR
jgi:hypothetical protein